MRRLGHSDVLAGVLVVKDSARYGDLLRTRITLGSVMGNLENYLLLRSLRTLEVRVKAQSANALVVAEWLEKQSTITKVWYPSLKSMGDSHTLAKQLFKMPLPIMSFELSTAFEAIELCNAVKVIGVATSLGALSRDVYRNPSNLK